ncbi:DHS-like NAD/FAD-binding domain-containing protein, partial [Kalaharituber pfeilii]
MPIITVTKSDHRILQTISDTIHSSRKILVITGAGISTNSGIPDFRSTHGLYNQVKARYPSASTSNITQGKDLFDSVLFSDPTMTSIFYTFLAELRSSVLKVEDTTPTHKFIRTLAETGRLLRCYTQNIDGLEGREGLLTDLSLGKGPSNNSRKRKRCSGCQVVQLHGELDTLRCMHCQVRCAYDDDRVAALMEGRAPDCPSCLTKDRERREAGKRGTRVGGLRPNIVLYGEEHPQGDLIGSITTSDLSAKPDLMIIFGTSLKVHGLKKLVKAFAASIHARKGSGPNVPPRVIFVNNQPAAYSVWKDTIDAWVDMDCDEFVAEVKKRRPAVWERQERLEA